MNNKKIKIISITVVMVFLMSKMVFAADASTEALDNVVNWMATWVGRIGLVVAFFGGIQTSLGFKNDDADAKVRGLKTLASGFMVFGVSKSLDLFGL